MPRDKKARANENGDASPQNEVTSPVNGEAPLETSETPLELSLKRVATEFGHTELRGSVPYHGSEHKFSKLIMVNASAIPCSIEKFPPTKDDKGNLACKLSLVHVQYEGFSAAPYILPFGGGKGKTGENAKPLSVMEEAHGGGAPGLRMWPFKKEAVPGSRGARIEVMPPPSISLCRRSLTYRGGCRTSPS